MRKKNKITGSRINPDDWILLALLGANKRLGVNLTNWFLTKRPKALDKISPSEFNELVKKIENNNLIKQSAFESNYCLTEKGENIARSPQ